MVVRYVVAACAGAFIVATPARAENAPLAEIMSSETNDSGVSVTVATGGCTSKSDFQVNTHVGATGVTEVEFRRLNEDRCKGNFPDGVKLQFTWGDLTLPAGSKLAVKNPVEAGKALPKAKVKRVLKKKKKAVKRCLRSKYRKHGCVKRRVRRTKPLARRAHRNHRHHHCCHCFQRCSPKW